MVLGKDGLAWGTETSMLVVEAATARESAEDSPGLSLCSNVWCFWLQVLQVNLEGHDLQP